MREYLETRSDKSVSTNSLSVLASIILKNNFSEKGELKYHQKGGTTIGRKFAPPYSNLFMAGFEKRVFQNSESKPVLWLRYLEDIFCVRTQGFQKLNEFDCINSLHPTIKFAMDYSKTEINFLDVTVAKVGNSLETDLYCKRNYAHQYLYKKSIVSEQTVRIKRICSTKENLNNRLQQLTQWLVNREYREDHVDSEI